MRSEEKKINDAANVDETMKELETHGSFELPVETYTDNCEVFRSLYNHWHREMEIVCIDQGKGLARLNRETIRLKKGDLLIVNSGVIHGIKSDSRNILYYRSVAFDLNFLSGSAGDICQAVVEEDCAQCMEECRAWRSVLGYNSARKYSRLLCRPWFPYS